MPKLIDTEHLNNQEVFLFLEFVIYLFVNQQEAFYLFYLYFFLFKLHFHFTSFL